MNWPWQESSFERTVRGSLVLILNAVQQLSNEVIKMSEQIDALKAQVVTLVANVAKNTDVIDSATAAFTGMTDQIAVLTKQLQEAIDTGNLVAVQEAADALAEQNAAIIEATGKLAAAIPANTPAAVK